MTGGSRAGVMKDVGKAVREFAGDSTDDPSKTIVLLGVAPWGKLDYDKRDCLSTIAVQFDNTRT